MREALGFSQQEMAKSIGVSFRSVQDYERGLATPGGAVFEALCNLGFNGTWLLTGRGPMRSGAEVPSEENFVFVPRYNVKAAAGAGARVELEQAVDRLAFRREWISRRLGVAQRNLALIEVTGDSMAPTMRAGDLLLIDLSDRTIRGGNVYVVRSGDELQVKRVQVRADQSVVLLSDNPAYPPEELARKTRPEVLGRVLWVGGEL